MTRMQSIRMKIRDFELEGIGFKSFEEFEPILNRALEIWKGSSSARQRLQNDDLSSPSHEPEPRSGSVPDITINTFVARVGGDSCRDLLKASAGYLAIVGSQERIRHEELISTAKSSSRWKKSYSNMMSRDLKRMIENDEIVENASGQYSLPSTAIDEMSAKLGNG